MLIKQKSPLLPRNLALGTFGKLLIVFSSKVNLLDLLYSMDQRCCLLHLIKQNCLLKTFPRNLILMTPELEIPPPFQKSSHLGVPKILLERGNCSYTVFEVLLQLCWCYFCYIYVGGSFYCNYAGDSFCCNYAVGSFCTISAGESFCSKFVGDNFYWNYAGGSLYCNHAGSIFYSGLCTWLFLL